MINEDYYKMISEMNTPDIIRLYEYVKCEYNKRKDGNVNFRQAKWQALNPEKINKAVKRCRVKNNDCDITLNGGSVCSENDHL